MPAISYPKIAVVHGAETELGEHLVTELVQSFDIDRVHALISTETHALRRLVSAYPNKLRLHTATLDKLEIVFDKEIPECDLAFCCLSTSRNAYTEMGNHRFRSINYEIPRRFVQKAFDLGVLHVSLLSHASADPSSRTLFMQMRGELESDVKKLRKEAADFSPYISIFKINSVSSQPQYAPANGMRRRPSSEHLVEKLSSKLGNDARHKIHISELAVAMLVDSLAKAEKQFDCLECDYRKGGHKFAELDTTDILHLYQDAKMVERGQRGKVTTSSRNPF